MLDFDTALDLLNKYGFTSIQVHPFIYQDGDTIGICYTYIDEEYGLLERIKIFNNASEFEEFLKMYTWVKENGKKNHVRMILDNYESINPKVMFLRNEKIMVEGEMFDIESYDAREAQRINMDPASKVIYECGDLLLVYNEIKNRQLQYLSNIIKLRNALRRKYYDLQIEVDKYNKVKVERRLNLLPEVIDSGINDSMEAAIKDRYNVYITQVPSYEEALVFLKEVWNLCLQLELNVKYYEALKDETDIRNETKVVEEKLTYMRELNNTLKPLLGTDLVGKFRKINRECKATSSEVSKDYINQQNDTVNRKYSYFDKIDSLYTSDYLREATQNSNFADLAIKYATGTNYEAISMFKTPLNEVAASLSIQYRDKLTVDEQSILMLYNNPKYRVLCNKILNIKNFETVSEKIIIKELNKIKGFSKIKSECYDAVKRRLLDPVNQKIKDSIFHSYDFTTFESFVLSLVRDLAKLKNVNEKMVLNGDINMYITVNKVDSLAKKLFVTTTNDLQSLIIQAKNNKDMIGITLLKEGTPVLYSPYYFDVGDLYTKGASNEMFIKEMINFELLIDISDIIINVDAHKTYVTKYYSEPNVVGNLSIVDHIKMEYKTKFCKFALTSNSSKVMLLNQSSAVASRVTPVASSVFDAGTLASETSNSVSDGTFVDATTSEVSETTIEPVIAVATNEDSVTTLNTSESVVEDIAVQKEIKNEPDTKNVEEITTEVETKVELPKIEESSKPVVVEEITSEVTQSDSVVKVEPKTAEKVESKIEEVIPSTEIVSQPVSSKQEITEPGTESSVVQSSEPVIQPVTTPTIKIENKEISTQPEMTPTTVLQSVKTEVETKPVVQDIKSENNS